MRALSITRLPVPHHMRLTTCLRGKNETTFIKTTSGRNLAGSTSSFCQHPSNKPTSRYGGPRTLLADPFIASSTWDERRKTSDDQHFNDSTCVAMGKGDWGRSGVPSRQAGEINSRGMECGPCKRYFWVENFWSWEPASLLKIYPLHGGRAVIS